LDRSIHRKGVPLGNTDWLLLASNYRLDRAGILSFIACKCQDTGNLWITAALIALLFNAFFIDSLHHHHLWLLLALL